MTTPIDWQWDYKGRYFKFGHRDRLWVYNSYNEWSFSSVSKEKIMKHGRKRGSKEKDNAPL